jgi:hypothetical protein
MAFSMMLLAHLLLNSTRMSKTLRCRRDWFSELLGRPRVNWTRDSKSFAHSKPVIGQTSESEQIVEVLSCAKDANNLEDGFDIAREDAVEEESAFIDGERAHPRREVVA